MFSLPKAAQSLISAFSVAFTHPTFRRAQLLMLEAILSPRHRTITAMLRAVAPLAKGHWSDYHRLLCCRVWSTWPLGKALAAMILELIPADQPVVYSTDPTLTPERIVNDCIMPFKSKPFAPKIHIMAVRITIVALCVLFFFVGTLYTPTLPIWEFLWLLANIIAGTGIAVQFGMYWRRANSYGAYAAIMANFLLPLADLTARWIYKANGWEYQTGAEDSGRGRNRRRPRRRAREGRRRRELTRIRLSDQNLLHDVYSDALAPRLDQPPEDRAIALAAPDRQPIDSRHWMQNVGSISPAMPAAPA